MIAFSQWNTNIEKRLYDWIWNKNQQFFKTAMFIFR